MNINNNMNMNNNMNNMNNMNKMNNMNMMNNMNVNMVNNMNMNNMNMMNNNANMNNQNQASSNPQEAENTIFVTFTFKKNKKQIYIDIGRNQTFKEALDILKNKYEWLKTIPNQKYSFNDRIIKESEFDKTITQLKIDESSDIFILTD